VILLSLVVFAGNRFSQQPLDVVTDRNLFEQLLFFPQQKLPLSLRFVFGPVLVGLGDVGAQVEFLPKVSAASGADKRLDLDVVVHAVVVQNALSVKNLVWANWAFKFLCAGVGGLVMNFQQIFVLKYLVALCALDFGEFMGFQMDLKVILILELCPAPWTNAFFGAFGYGSVRPVSIFLVVFQLKGIRKLLLTLVASILTNIHVNDLCMLS